MQSGGGSMGCTPFFCLSSETKKNMCLKMARIIGCIAACFELLIGLNIAKAEQGVSAKTNVSFSGRIWKVKSSETRVGPGANYFSDNKDNVWVDDAGKLHLKIAKTEGQWRCAEIISEDSFGLGTYRFYVSTPLAKLDPNITLGLFTWSDAREYAHREIDIECSKWGKAADTNNAQFVVQPYQPRGRLLRYHVPKQLDAATYSFTWQSNSVLFKCVEGHTTAFATNDSVIQEWNFTKGSIPSPGDEKARMNLWICAGRAPLDSNDTEIVISKFEFLPLSVTRPRKD
jgi:hypothetical protein